MLMVGAVACGIATVCLTLAAIRCWLNPELRTDALPLVIFFGVVFAYRFFRFLKLLKGENKIEARLF